MLRGIVLIVLAVVVLASSGFPEKPDQGGARTVLGEREREIIGKDGAPMILVPNGEFTMGDGSYNNLERPVYLDAYYIDKFELTVSRYAKYMDHIGTKHGWTKADLLSHGDRPVVEVDWNDADAYCRWARKRLPNEAEWEKAARGTDGRIYPWGNEKPNPSLANFDWDGRQRWEGYRTLSVVGSYEAGKSPYGLYDMAGATFWRRRKDRPWWFMG
jgi:formylglycine-generating enzyme required for sulfatase activity